MAVATEKIIPGVLPPKEERADVDFLSIYDSFDATTLSDDQLKKFAPRNPYVTAWNTDEQRYYKVNGVTYPIPDSPIEERLHHGQFCMKSYRQDIEAAVSAWKNGSSTGYKNARQVLIQAIGYKACTEYVQRIYDAMTEEQRREDQVNWKRWSKYCDDQRAAEQAVFEKDPEDMTDWELELLEEKIYGPDIPEGYTADRDWRHENQYIPVMSLKLQKIRKAAGFTQRDFAKKIGYNINKYALLEQGKLEKLGFTKLDEAFPGDLVKKVVDLTYCNPYWLEDLDEYSADEVDENMTAMTVEDAKFPEDQYPMFVDAKVIRYWWGHR